MPHLRRLAAALGVLFAVAGCTSSSPDHPPTTAPPPPGSKPSLVLVLGHDLSPDLIRFMPHVVDLERSGTSFTRFISTGTDRTPIFTGRYAHNADPGDPTFALALQRAGYRTALIGNYAAGYQLGHPAPPGWDEWDVASGTASGFNYDLDENGSVQHYGHAPQDYLLTVLAAKAAAFIASAARDGKPYVLVVAPPAPGPFLAPTPGLKGTFPGLGAPHGPAFGRLPTDPPAWLAAARPLSGVDLLRLDADYERRVEVVQSLDQLVRRIGHAVNVTPAHDNTYVALSSDSAYHEGEHRLLAGTGTAFDTDIRVPLIVRGPNVAANATIDTLASGVDLAPTFEELAGLPPATGTDGTSLAPWLHGTVPSDAQQAVLVEQPAGLVHQPLRAGRPPDFAAVRTATTLYVSYAGGGVEYYNLTDDPTELHNVAATASAAQLSRLRATLLALRGCRGTASCQAAAAR